MAALRTSFTQSLSHTHSPVLTPETRLCCSSLVNLEAPQRHLSSKASSLASVSPFDLRGTFICTSRRNSQTKASSGHSPGPVDGSFDSPSKARGEMPSSQPGNPPPSQQKQPSSDSTAPLPADPQWKDVFPTYLQNRESDVPSRILPSTPSPSTSPRVNQSLGPSSSTPGFSLGPTTYGSPSSAYYSPADVTPKYLREATSRTDPIWAAIRAEARLEVQSRSPSSAASSTPAFSRTTALSAPWASSWPTD